MDRLSQLRGEAGGSRDSTLDTTSPPSEAFMTANESSSKYYSLSEVDSTFDITSMKDDISSIKDVSLASTATESEGTITNSDELISNLSPIGKKSDILDSYKIDTQIEAANILSGGVAIFDDNDNSYDGHELVIDDNVEVDEKSNSELKQSESLQFKPEDNIIDSSLISEEASIASKDTEVVLQIDGKSVEAIDIGNGLYLYRKAGQEELAAVQITDDDQQQTNFKFLKVRENAEGNLEVYEEIEIEVPKEVPAKEGKMADKNTLSHVPIMDINKVISDAACNKVAERKVIAPRKETTLTTIEDETEKKESPPDKSEVNLNGKMMKFSESRKSPVIGSFTPMTYHSTPNKEGKPLTKTMVNQQLHTSRHSDLSNVKKTIEVHTDSCKQKTLEMPNKNKDADNNKSNEIAVTEKDITTVNPNTKDIIIEEKKNEINDAKVSNVTITDPETDVNKPESIVADDVSTRNISETSKEISLKQDIVIDSSEKVTKEKPEESLQIAGSNEDNSDKNLVIVDEAKAKVKIVIEKSEEKSKTLVKESDQIDGSKVEDIVPVDDKYGESKDEPMDIDDETELTIVETYPSVEESKEIVDDSNQFKEKDAKQVKNIVDKQEQALVVEEAILIEDDDVSIVEEVIVESKDKENVKIQENVFCDSKSEAKLDDNSKIDTLANISKINENKTKYGKLSESLQEVVPENKVKDEVQADLSSVHCVIHPNSKKDLVVVEVKENKKHNIVSYTETKNESKNNSISIPLPENQTIKDTISTSSTDTLNKGTERKLLQQEPKEVLVKPPIDELICATEPLTVTVDQHDTKPIESTDVKEAKPKVTAKHDIPSNISPLLDHKYQPLVAPKVVKEKTVDNEKNEVKNPTPSVQHFNTVSELKIESKVPQTSLRKEPDNLIKITESVSLVGQIRVSSSVPITVARVVVKDKAPQDSNIMDIQEKGIPQLTKKPTVDKPQLTSDSKRSFAGNKDDRKDIKLPSKDIASEKGKGVMNIEITKVPKLDPAKTNVFKQDISSSSSKITIQAVKNKIEPKGKREPPRVIESKPINNNNAAVPFGKWTEANRQEFLNKFKTKASVASTNSNQLKNSNDLNRRDVLKKIDSQRQSSNALSKIQEANKPSMKPETAAFSNKPNIITKEVTQEIKIPQKTETVEMKPKPASPKHTAKVEVLPKTQNELSQTATGTSVSKKEVCQRTGVVQNLIDKTIEGMIHRSAPGPKSQDEPKQNTNKESSAPKPTKPQQTYPIEQATLDAIEMKMNELHGIPFIERPPHELPQVPKTESKSFSKTEKEKLTAPIKTKIPNLLPFPNKSQQKVVKDTVIEVESEDEIIEHEPITGDIDLNKKNQTVKPQAKEKLPSNIIPQVQQEKPISDTAKKDAIITEKDFDKFARRNSITYENCLTVNFDSKEPHNVVQTVVEKDLSPKGYTRNDASGTDSKVKLPYKYQNVHANTQPAKVHSVNKFGPANDDASNRNQSKLQKAYHSALTAKRQMAAECPITIIEDKPVKVVFIDNVDYVPSQLNVQGQDLSPAKRVMPESDVTVSTCDSLDSDMLDSIDDAKSQNDTKIKTKHQRKQVLTPVDEPELELIEPRDLGIDVSPKKKRKTDDEKTDKNLKYPMRKKFYMLGSSAVTEEKIMNPVEVIKNPLKETVNLNDNGAAHKNPVSALDSLVKAAELIETQTENINSSIVSSPDNQPSTPVKRGRGRPRKYPLTPDGTVDKTKVATPSPQKKPRLIDAKIPKRDTLSDDSDSEGAIIKENWTMGKINENIVCPICNKLFRTENVVFKHVKHCTGPSPSRSDSDKRSPRRMRISQDFDTKSRDSKSDDMDIDDDKPLVTRKETPKKRKSKDSITKSDDKDDIIVIEDTPIKEKPDKIDERKHHESRKSRIKIPHKSNDLVCEFCGKTFRQLSYLVSHKLQHKKQEKIEPKKTEKDPPVNKSVYSCEVCKKEFRKLHHLVQHRIIHNPSSIPVRSNRKSSSEQSESKIEKEPGTSKQSDDPSAGFRCEPCDKSFRKLHHLVEHRETHDGINRQKTTTVPATKEEKTVEKPVMIHECDICKKTFRKLQHFNEHKEIHVETSSEKSDEISVKSVKSSLSTRDIIHECSLCYMVFPNEHSLNKHTIICQRKKRQSKQQKPSDETEGGDEVIESPPPEEKVEGIDAPKPIFEITNEDDEKKENVEKVELIKDKPDAKELERPNEKCEEPVKVLAKEKDSQKLETKVSVQQVPPAKRDFVKTETAATEAIPEVPEKMKKVEEKEPVKIHETPKKKTPLKDKSATKRFKTMAAPKPVAEEVKPAVESSDDDDVRYMLNPNFKPEDVTEEKVFMKVRAKKRSSLQIERPNSKDLVKRRTSLQHPPKIPRLKPKIIENNTATVKKENKTSKLEPVPSTDSDDSETTKYSFPSTIPEKQTKPAQDRAPKDAERKIQKKSLADKRKSLSGIAKRKSLGKVATARHKASPLKPVKKRTLDAEHRCDCGQLFSSAALLSRHTTLAHTPPRIRRRRSPPPEEKPIMKPPPRKSSAAEKPKQSAASRKSSVRSDNSTSTNTKQAKREVIKPEKQVGRKSQVKDAESQSDSRKSKPEKSEAKSSVKPLRSSGHRGVPVPDKMKKLMHKK